MEFETLKEKSATLIDIKTDITPSEITTMKNYNNKTSIISAVADLSEKLDEEEDEDVDVDVDCIKVDDSDDNEKSIKPNEIKQVPSPIKDQSNIDNTCDTCNKSFKLKIALNRHRRNCDKQPY